MDLDGTATALLSGDALHEAVAFGALCAPPGLHQPREGGTTTQRSEKILYNIIFIDTNIILLDHIIFILIYIYLYHLKSQSLEVNVCRDSIWSRCLSQVELNRTGAALQLRFACAECSMGSEGFLALDRLSLDLHDLICITCYLCTLFHIYL